MKPDEYTRERMQVIARFVDDEIPVGWGFLVLVFPTELQEGRANYVSNITDRESIKKVMAEFIEETRPGWGKHI